MEFIGYSDTYGFFELGPRACCRERRISLYLGVIIINHLAIDDGGKPFIYLEGEQYIPVDINTAEAVEIISE